MKTNYFIIIILVILLSISMALNYIFYKKSFIPLHALRLDPMELEYYPSTTVEVKENTVVFYGDSRSLSWPFAENDQFHFINRSIGSQTSIQIVKRFITHVAPYKPSIILVQMCINDLKMIPLFPEQKARIITDCKNNIMTLLEQANDINAKVILTTVFPLADISLDRKALGMREQVIIEAIDEVNLFIKTLQAENRIIFDSYQLLVGKDRKIDSRYSHDWLHLNNLGYQHLNKHLEKLLSPSKPTR
ncbi:MAG: SGNH/GDSL hydrolase family protein [Thiotrichaceae bacterium]|nr:SGNH/GDSL hydrolase family protein [Thiotrichaceae bacterium]